MINLIYDLYINPEVLPVKKGHDATIIEFNGELVEIFYRQRYDLACVLVAQFDSRRHGIDLFAALLHGVKKLFCRHALIISRDRQQANQHEHYKNQQSSSVLIFQHHDLPLYFHNVRPAVAEVFFCRLSPLARAMPSRWLRESGEDELDFRAGRQLLQLRFILRYRRRF